MRKVKPAFVVGILLLGMITGAAALQGPVPHGEEQLAVFDANGKRVASIVDFSYPVNDESLGIEIHFPNIAMRMGDQLLMLGVTHDRFFGTNTTYGAVVFQSDDCTGTPYWDEPPSSSYLGLVPISAVLSDGTIYVRDPTGPAPFFLEGHSFLFHLATPSTCQQSDINLENAVQLRVLTNLHQHFQPPFSVR